jgi:hypothetical protein
MSLVSRVDLSVHSNEHPAKESRYLSAGAPTRCQRAKCDRPFDGRCVRGDDDRYYCSEECAQVGREVDLGKFPNVVRLGSAAG